MSVVEQAREHYNKAMMLAGPELMAIIMEFSSVMAVLEALDGRRMEQAKEIMALQADLSTAQTKIAEQRAAVEQHWRDSCGHNHCIRNNPRLWEKFGLVPQTHALPPRDEFELGCKAFQDELYVNTGRWPDFVQIG